MFLFSCCTSHEGQYAYQIRQDYEKVSQTSSALDLQQKINNSKQYVRKVKRSKFQQLLKSSKKEMFKDLEFPPNRESMGQIPSIQTCNWRRLSQIVPKPSLFTTSKSTILKKSKQSLTPDYFLSAMSAITEKPRRIKDFFKTETINDSGLYCVMLRVNGQIQEVIVDDYVPVNEIGQPIFAEPNSGEIWICLAEKAWAKINGSYANILNGNSAQVFKAFNFAPSQIFFLEDKQEKKQKLWKRLTEAAQRKSPVSCLTSHNQTVDWIHLNLIPNFQYTLVYATQVLHKDKKSYRMIKLKNPYSEANWDGKGSSTDAQFWGNVLASQEKINLLQNIDSKQGEFTMLYTDFVKYFSEIYISYQLQQGNFIWEEVFFNQKNGGFWQIDVTHDGQYSFELHKQSQRNKEQTGSQNSYCRSTIVLAKVTQLKQYEFVSGAMRFAEQDVLVNAFLKQGKYIVYVKIQSPKGHSLYHGKSSLSCYSNRLCRFRYVEKKTCQNFLQNMFLNFARQNKRQQYNRQKMWLSWKLLFKECGFAFIAFGNAADSDKKFTVKFQSKDFQSMHFKLKSPFKADKTKENTVYQINIMPGEQKIILARVINDGVITLKFPPPIEMKIQDLKQ